MSLFVRSPTRRLCVSGRAVFAAASIGRSYSVAPHRVSLSLSKNTLLLSATLSRKSFPSTRGVHSATSDVAPHLESDTHVTNVEDGQMTTILSENGSSGKCPTCANGPQHSSDAEVTSSQSNVTDSPSRRDVIDTKCPTCAS
ncbi:hypothetical protein FISHEDRAFT_69550 [Fistulina hepatica ATCC 64428]|uniref:Uncharacterized protein n=1 Tax=Fistulina hepatica ATCC 64428 TaxID=1128425 RepID=A0A0D7AN56_9AGAR|nr:hypothetical protein FISHEDRAFT_69550 [Fistulina hepatica ATCC 64428]